MNLSGGRETFIPVRLLYGVVPQALLDAYMFWRDESSSPRNTFVDYREQLSGYQRLRGYPIDKDGEHIIFVEIHNIGSWERFSGVKPSRVDPSTTEQTLECTGFPGRSVRISRRLKKDVESEFHQYCRIAQLVESLALISHSNNTKEKIDDNAKDESSGLKFNVDDKVECDIEGNNEFLPCIVSRINDDGTYDLEFVGEFKWMGIQRGKDPDSVQKIGEFAKAKRGENVWHWEGMSDDEDDDWREKDSDDGIIEIDDDDGHKKKKHKLLFVDFDNLWILLNAAGGSESILLTTLESIGTRSDGTNFKSLIDLSALISQLSSGTVSGSNLINIPNYGQLYPYTHEDDYMVMLNLLYAPRKTRLFSILKVLTRIEHAGHICAWTKGKNLKVFKLFSIL